MKTENRALSQRPNETEDRAITSRQKYLMMADNQLLNNNGVDGGDEIFVYTGGEQQVPRDVKRVRIAENVDTIPARTLNACTQLIEVEGHDKIMKIEGLAFGHCSALRTLTKMTGVKEIGAWAFDRCSALSDLDFDKLEIIYTVQLSVQCAHIYK